MGQIIPFTLDGTLETPKIGSESWIAPDAWVIGACTIGTRCTVLFGAVVRGDVLPIKIGDETNIQDGAIIHTSTGLSPTEIGRGVTIGHRAIVHGCSIADNCLIGMGAIVLDGAWIGEGSIIGANALITKGIVIPPRSLVLGSPGKVIRTITDEEFNQNIIGAQHYVEKGAQYHSLLDKKSGRTN